MSKTCYHCGDDVIGKGIHYDDKVFCCNGCKSVYQLLSSNELGGFYDLEANAGVKPEGGNEHRFAFLQVDEIAQNSLILKMTKVFMSHSICRRSIAHHVSTF
jgi:Cu+-exporting ATPase